MAALHRPSSGSGGATPWLAYLTGALVVVILALAWRGCGDQLASHPSAIAANLRLPSAPSIPKLPKPPSMPQ